MLGSSSIIKNLQGAVKHAPKLIGGRLQSFSTKRTAQGLTLLQDRQNGYGFARSNPRPPKPRSKGVTEIRGPYYSVKGVDDDPSGPYHDANYEPGNGKAVPSRYPRDVIIFPL